MKIYVSIPMKNKDELIQRRRAKRIQNHFEGKGYEVVNPFELGDRLKRAYLKIAKKEPTYDQYLKEDLANLEDCDLIFMDKGWSESNGCMEEITLAKSKDIEIILGDYYEIEGV